MGSTARTIGGLDGTAHCPYPRSCCIPAVCCMHKLPAIGNYFHVCGMQDLVDPIYFDKICMCVTLFISFFFFDVSATWGQCVP